MSFTTDIKKELTGIIPKSSCCRKSIGAGLEFCSYGTGNKRKLDIDPSDETVNAFAAKMLHEKYKAETVCSLNRARGRSIGEISFDIPIPPTRCHTDNVSECFKCNNCAAAFIRGVFLACGSVSDPASCYHAEFRLGSAEQAKKVFEVLTDLRCPPKIINRDKCVGLYYKSSEDIETLLVLIGANNSAFRLINCKIEREIRNSENRATNCVATNISKTVKASIRQVADIEALIGSGRFEMLPDDIRTTARLRIENPDISLRELALLHKPPISKSGLNHRLMKISEEAKKITDK